MSAKATEAMKRMDRSDDQYEDGDVFSDNIDDDRRPQS